MQFGGHCEPTTPALAEAALRETVEESGIDGLELVGDRPIQLDTHEVRCGPLRPAHHLDVRFAVVAPAGGGAERQQRVGRRPLVSTRPTATGTRAVSPGPDRARRGLTHRSQRDRSSWRLNEGNAKRPSGSHANASPSPCERLRSPEGLIAAETLLAPSTSGQRVAVHACAQRCGEARPGLSTVCGHVVDNRRRPCAKPARASRTECASTCTRPCTGCGRKKVESPNRPARPTISIDGSSATPADTTCAVPLCGDCRGLPWWDAEQKGLLRSTPERVLSASTSAARPSGPARSRPTARATRSS